MDRPIQELNTKKSFPQNCIHTKHIYSFYDMSKNDESYGILKKHLESCSICNSEFQNFQLKNTQALILIPKVSMDRDLRHSFEREVVELFKAMDLNDRILLKRNVKQGFIFIDKMGIEFIHNLFSKSMLKTYVFALVVFIGLKIFL